MFESRDIPVVGTVAPVCWNPKTSKGSQIWTEIWNLLKKVVDSATHGIDISVQTLYMSLQLLQPEPKYIGIIYNASFKKTWNTASFPWEWENSSPAFAPVARTAAGRLPPSGAGAAGAGAAPGTASGSVGTAHVVRTRKVGVEAQHLGG